MNFIREEEVRFRIKYEMKLNNLLYLNKSFLNKAKDFEIKLLRAQKENEDIYEQQKEKS